MMEGIGSEVSHKIRAAIKAKLIELGAYIDDELPDYIMVMVANKRSRHQMDEDLQLFLGSNTKTFTTWLHTVLQKLQEVTVANFEIKKDEQATKSGKKKSSNSEESSRKDRKSSEERSKTSKKHSKKHKEGKKAKKSKHKSKDKEKCKNLDKRQIRHEAVENEKEGKNILDEEIVDSHDNGSINVNDDKTGGKDCEGIDKKVDSSYETAGLESSEKSDKLKNLRREGSHSSGSASHFTDAPLKTKAGNGHEDGKSTQQNNTGVIEDEFNIEPLQPNEIGDQLNSEKLNENVEDSRSEPQVSTVTSSGMTIKAPTRELLKEHDKIHSETEDIISKGKKSNQDSDDSLSPEEIRKQLLLSRAKKKLEQSKIPGRMKSNSPEVELIENNSNGKQDRFSSHRITSSSNTASHRREYEEELKTKGSNYGSHRHENVVEGRRNSPVRFRHDNENSQTGTNSRNDQKKNVISISKSLEMEKNLGVKSEDHKKSRNKTTSSSKKKPVPSRIVTIPEPQAPEISSIVKVKPREYIPKDKQANKALILKAVADAEKSIATVHSRNDGDVEMKKSAEGIFTKNLRGKRYEKLAVTLSNVQGGVVDRDKTKRMVSVDSENTNALDRKTESFKGSELSQGFRSIQELTLKNISNKSEDQFISSKTSAMEKNDKYIHCWLEGVEKAVKDDEIVNPSEIDDFHGPFCDEGKEDDGSVRDEERKRKKQKTDDGGAIEDENPKRSKTGEKTNNSTKSNKEDGPQIVVTLDGLTSKAIKDIILRNRDTLNGPLLAAKKSDKGKELSEVEEVAGKGRYKDTDSSKNVGTSRHSDSEGRDKMSGFEKISERFGRINKTSESHEYKEKYYEFERERYEKKYLKYQGTDKEKHYEKLKDKYASAGESKNKKLIARLSEKFGKVDREFENKKRKYSEDDLRYSYSGGRRVDGPVERDGKYRKMDRKSLRSDYLLKDGMKSDISDSTAFSKKKLRALMTSKSSATGVVFSFPATSYEKENFCFRGTCD